MKNYNLLIFKITKDNRIKTGEGSYIKFPKGYESELNTYLEEILEKKDIKEIKIVIIESLLKGRVIT